MKRVLIHNFYSRKAPSGEDNFVRQQRADLKIFTFSELFYKKYNKSLVFLRARSKVRKRLSRLLKRKHEFQEIEIHNIHPLIPSKQIKMLSNDFGVTVYAHNFRLAAPCAVLMDKSGKHCKRCISNPANLVLAPLWKCYNNSFTQTLVVTLQILRSKLFKHLNNVEKVVTFSEFHKKSLQGLFGDNTKFEIIKNIDENIVSNYVPQKSNRSVAYLGRISYEKGILQLARMWPTSDNFHLHIYGTGDLTANIREICDIRCNIHYHGFVETHLLAERLKKHTTIIIPSVCSEGYPSVIKEAVDGNLNIITGRVDPQQEHVLKLGGQTYNVASARDLYDKLNAFNEDSR